MRVRVLALALALHDKAMPPCPLVIPPRLHHRRTFVRVRVRAWLALVQHRGPLDLTLTRTRTRIRTRTSTLTLTRGRRWSRARAWAAWTRVRSARRTSSMRRVWWMYWWAPTPLHPLTRPYIPSHPLTSRYTPYRWAPTRRRLRQRGRCSAIPGPATLTLPHLLRTLTSP